MKQSLAILTSGGDAPGMNAFVRAAVLTCLHEDVPVYGVFEGYQGLIDGGEHIRLMSARDVDLILSRGGTMLGTARCLMFREREGRLIAAKNLVERNISRLVVCGGDGSLTGANLFQNEWGSLLKELFETNVITESQYLENTNFEIVGCVGSIDNDLVYKGELTIGTDTALHRIVECIDAVIATAASHQRTFILEVMGRNCGYLALGAAMACGADFVLIPEAPPQTDEWTQLLIQKLKKRRQKGKRSFLIILAEGAVDRHGARISSDYIKTVLEKTNFFDVRITVLGHVQRGGTPSAYDRINGTICGAACVQYLLQRDLIIGDQNQLIITQQSDNTITNAKSDESNQSDHLGDDKGSIFELQAAVKNIVIGKKAEAQIIGLRGFSLTYDSLVDSVKLTQAVEHSAKKLDFDKAISLRGHNYSQDYQYHLLINGTMSRANDRSNLIAQIAATNSSHHTNTAAAYSALSMTPAISPNITPNVSTVDLLAAANSSNKEGSKTIGILNIGAPAAGMNCTVRAAVRYALNFNYLVVGIENGVEGLIDNRIRQLDFMSVDQWALEGGSILGTNRTIPETPEQWEKVYATLKTHAIDSLLVIATISNNVPGTQISIGADTAMNAIVDAIDKAKTSAYSSTHRVFIIETQGGYCGFLALLSSLAAGVDAVFTREEGLKMDNIMDTIKQIKDRMSKGKTYSIVVKNEWCSPTYTIDFIAKIMAEESGGLYDVRKLVLGHLCQGLHPSPLDRIRASKLAAKAVERLDIKMNAIQSGKYASDKESTSGINNSSTEPILDPSMAMTELVGFHDGVSTIINIQDVFDAADLDLRLPKTCPWLLCSPLLKKLAGNHPVSN